VEQEPEPRTPPAAEETRPRRADHALARQGEGRPVGTAFNDVQRATQADVFVQPDGRYVVRGPRGREHIFAADGTHITTFWRSQSAHDYKVARGERQPVMLEAFIKFREQFR
jgi:hypothetical protein